MLAGTADGATSGSFAAWDRHPLSGLAPERSGARATNAPVVPSTAAASAAATAHGAHRRGVSFFHGRWR
jgi:hypothetical protein